MAYAREEAQQVMFGTLDALFCNIGIKPRDISIFVVNCSLFNPTPSLSAIAEKERKKRFTQLYHNRIIAGDEALWHPISLVASLLTSLPHATTIDRDQAMNRQDLSRMKSPLFCLPSPLLHLLHHDPKSVSLPELSPSGRQVPMIVRKGARSPASEPCHCLF